MSVVDASAVLAVVNKERERVAAAALIKGGTISPVNAAEVMQDMVKSGRTIEAAAAIFDGFGLTLAAITRAQAVRAAELCTIPKLSIADRFCIALGEELGQPLVTKDSQWLSLTGLKTTIDFIS